MLDEVHLSRLPRHNSLGGERLAYLRDAHAVGGTGSEVQPSVRPQCHPQQFVRQMSLGIARNRDMVRLRSLETCLCSKHRQPRPVLDAIQPLLLERRHQLSVPQQRR